MIQNQFDVCQSTDQNENELLWIKLTLTMPWSYFGSVISIKATSGWVGSGSGYKDIVRGEFRTEIDNPLLPPRPPI